jgi:hypothetical protein
MTHRTRLAALVLAGGLALAACGDGGGGGGTTAAPPTGSGGAPTDVIGVGDTLEVTGEDTWPLAGGTLQPVGDRSVVVTCGSLTCSWPLTGGAGEVLGAGGEALSAAAGVALLPVQERVLVVDVVGGEVTAVFEEHEPTGDTTAPVRGAALGAVGDVAVSTGEDGTAWVWSTADGSVVTELDLGGGLGSTPVLSPDGERVALVVVPPTTGEAAAVVVLDASTGEVVGEPEGAVRVGAWAPDGGYLVGTDGDGEVAAWDTDDWSRTATSGRLGAGAVAVSPDSATVALVDRDRPTTVLLWTVSDGTVDEVPTDHPDPVSGITFSADGRLLATASTEATGEPAPTPAAPRDQVQVRDLERPGRVVRLDLPRP